VEGAVPRDEEARVLVVDDDEGSLHAVGALLRGLPARIELARSGEEALRHLLHEDFAVVVLDVQMPGMSGLETAALVRQRRRSRRTPIIFLTGHGADHEQVLRGYGLGAVDFLTKPVVPQEILRDKVAWFVDAQRQALELERERERAAAAERRELLAEAARRAEEQELRRRAADLAEADRRKDEFLAMLAHELRNPLAPVVGALEILRHDRATPDARRRALAAADRQVRHLARLVDDLGDVSRIRRGKVELRRAPLDLRGVLEDAVAAAEPLARAQGQALAAEVAPEPLWVDGDAVRLAQIVGNLLHNAVKYTDAGGHLALAAAREGPQIVVRVEDDGIGIAPDLLPQVFDPFVQAEQPAHRARGGLGLGLALVKSLVERHGGSVRAESAGPGRGSAFEVRLPAIAPPLAEPVPLRPTARRAALAPLRIAVIEDNPDIRETLRELLELRGHEVLEAEDGPQGVALVLARRPDVALVDIGLPGLDGYAVAARLRAACRTRLVALSGYGGGEDRSRAAEAGFEAHLVKPVEFEDLARVLERLTGPEGAEAAAAP
jgi:signal transduction histidine kinase